MNTCNNKGLSWPYSRATQPDAAKGSGTYQRSDGSKISMADMNPHHRAAAIKKAEREGKSGLADQLRASGPLPD
ncbi:hypothetical protein SAMN04487972_1195 [Paracoccus halophilus]|uniref:Uncharacterized protein n=1 Tax=Paracoccus halophilus TaxID=376733 RepID=A0A099F0H5_9RHOB|nr:hypothetical protein [Paracoccus halophilus]KGJ03647.1 hypothetical protein IT41_13625 [Paracoccus halophilus]SFA57928.1 hypothetical protein SAMN04487972_1195 [Paracoccus halophilus]